MDTENSRADSDCSTHCEHHSESRFKPFSFSPLLAQLEADQLLRKRLSLQSSQGTVVMIDHQRYLNFSSNDYLGLAADERLVSAFKRGASQYGVGSGASHMVCGHFDVHHQLEEALADWVGRPKALLFSSGYMANLGVIQALVGRGDTVFEDRLNHASLIDGGLISGARLHRYTHANVMSLTSKIERSMQRTPVDKDTTVGKGLMVTDSLFSMDGDVAPLKDLSRLAEQYRACLMVDEAHALGVMGDEGAGAVVEAGLSSQQVPVVVGTLSKALGCYGAFVAGDDLLIDYLQQKTRTSIYTTAIPPAICYAAVQGVQIARMANDLREELRERIAIFKQFADTEALPLMPSNSAIQPILIGETDKVLQMDRYLKQKNILVSAIRPPTVPKNAARLRVTISASHTVEQVEQLVNALSEAYQLMLTE